MSGHHNNTSSISSGVSFSYSENNLRSLETVSASQPPPLQKQKLYRSNSDVEKKPGSKLKRLKGKWGSLSGLADKQRKNLSLSTSAIPHYDLEFPSQGDLVSMVHDIQQYTKSRQYDDFHIGWKTFGRGRKYTTPTEFGLYWVVTDISPNLRFKIRFCMDPDRRQVFLNWDQHFGQITFFDGRKSHRIEFKMAIEPTNIWRVVVRGRKLHVYNEAEEVYTGEFRSDDTIVSVQPIRFSGKYYLTTPDGTLGNKNLMDLETSSVTTNDSDGEDRSYQFSESCNGSHSYGYPATTGSMPSLLDKSSSQVIQRDEIGRVKQLSAYLINLITQFEEDCRDNNENFRVKLMSLDKLSRKMMGMLETIQLENNDNKAEISRMKRRSKAEEASYVLQLESRIEEQTTYAIQLESRIEALETNFHKKSERNYDSLAEGFESVIQTYIDEDKSSSSTSSEASTSYSSKQAVSKAPPRTYSSFENVYCKRVDSKLKELEVRVNERVRTLNKRIKTDQSSVVRELRGLQNTVDLLKDDIKSHVVQLEAGINTCARENVSLVSRYNDIRANVDRDISDINHRLHDLETSVRSIDNAVEDLDNVINNEVLVTAGSLQETTHFNAVDDLTLAVIQEEDKRVDDLEKTYKDLIATVREQQTLMSQLKSENETFKLQIESLTHQNNGGKDDPADRDTLVTTDGGDVYLGSSGDEGS